MMALIKVGLVRDDAHHDDEQPLSPRCRELTRRQVMMRIQAESSQNESGVFSDRPEPEMLVAAANSGQEGEGVATDDSSRKQELVRMQAELLQQYSSARPLAPHVPGGATAEAVHGASTPYSIRRSSDRGESGHNVTDPSHLHPPSAIPATVPSGPAVPRRLPPQQPRPSRSRRCDDDLDRATQQAIAASQAAHTGHNRHQVTPEARFRRALELAWNECDDTDCPGGSPGDEAWGATPPSPRRCAASQRRRAEEDAVLERTVRQSLLDEWGRRSEAEGRRDLEEALFRGTVARSRAAAEAELLRDAVARSEAGRAREELGLRREEELLRRVAARSLEEVGEDEDSRLRTALARSLAEDAADEDPLLRTALARSLAEGAANGEGARREEEAQVRRVLAQSLGAEGKVGEDELAEKGRRTSASADEDPLLRTALARSLAEDAADGEGAWEEEAQMRRALARSLGAEGKVDEDERAEGGRHTAESEGTESELDLGSELEKALKLSLEEKEHIGEEEGEQLRKAMESSMTDCGGYVWRA